jgi:hypothetical protein
MRREGRIERGWKRLKDVWLHKIVQTGHIVLSEAGLMNGKTMTTLRTVLSAEEKPRQRRHKFRKDYEFLDTQASQIFVNKLLSHSLASPTLFLTLYYSTL